MDGTNECRLQLETIELSTFNETSKHCSDSMSNSSNLKQNLLSKVQLFEQRANGSIIIDKKMTKNFEKKASLKNTLEKNNSKEIINEEENTNNIEEIKEEEEEENDKKLQFNQVVEEMAQFYDNDNRTSYFYFSHFLEPLSIHFIYFLFGPLCMPILFNVFGRHFMRNMGLWGKKVGSTHILQIFYWVCFVITLIITLIARLSDKNSIWSQQYVFLSPAYIAMIMVLIRYIIVCVKYGFFPPEYYKKWKTTRLTRTEVKSNFLLQGWIKPSLLVLDVYLKEIFQKLFLDINSFRLECVGKLPTSTHESMMEVDRIINNDARRIRQSIFRRFIKESKFFNMINQVMKYYKIGNKSKKEEIGIKEIPKKIEKQTDLVEITEEDDNNMKTEILEEDGDNKTENLDENQESINAVNKITAKQRLRQIIINKILPDIRNKIKLKTTASFEDKVKYKNEYLYEISGIYLCRSILKKVFSRNFESTITTKIFVLIICLVPFIFTFAYYLYFNIITLEISGFSTTKLNSTSNNSTQSNSTDPLPIETIPFNYISSVLLLFSLISIIPPVWVNALNIQYGIVDIKRKKRLMEIITELINPNIKEEKREYPLLNVIHGKTMLNWYYLRNIFLSFGKRFSDRIIVQASVFCIFVVFTIFLSLLALFGFLNNFLAMCLGISLTFSALLNFLLIFRMFIYGADFNFYEYIHNDWMVTHKLFIDEMLHHPKLLNQKNKISGLNNLTNEQEFLINGRQSINISRLRSTIISKTSITSTEMTSEKQSKLKKYSIPNNRSSELFINLINLQDEFGDKPGDLNFSLVRTSRVLENIKEKIVVDSIVRPLKIFWIKSDYGTVGKIVAALGTGLAMLFGNLIKSVDLSNILKGFPS